jgi:hypothetical protein
VLAFLVAPMAALVLAALMPVTLAVVAVAVFGVAHLALETRYVVGRSSTQVPVPVLAWLFVPLTLIALLRLFPQGRSGTQVEALIALGLVAGAWAWCLRGRWPAWAFGLALLGGLLAGALRRPDLYAVAVLHVHNLTPLLFLWEWSRERGNALGRSLFRASQLLWAAVIPAVVLAGAVDGRAPSWLVWTGDRSEAQVSAVYSPAGWGDPWPSRLLVVFCFAQLMHYVIWCGFLPAVARDDHERAMTVGSVGRLFRPRLFVPLALATAVVLGVLQLASGTLGRRWYAAAASYHAYLEYPVLVVFALTLAGATISRHRRAVP